MTGQAPAPSIDDLDVDEPEGPSEGSGRRPRGWRGLILAAVPGIVVGVLNYCDGDHSKTVIASESARVDQSIWPEIVEHRKRVERLSERLEKLESRLARDELDGALERTGLPLKTHTSTVMLPPLPEDKPAPPTKEAAEAKKKELF